MLQTTKSKIWTFAQKAMTVNIFLVTTLFFMPISIGIGSFFLVLSLVYSFVALVLNFEKLTKGIKHYLILCYFFFFYALAHSVFNSSGHLLLKYLPIVFIPTLTLPIIITSKKELDYYKFFSLGLWVSMLLAMVRYLTNTPKVLDYLAIENLLKVHPTYFSLFLLVCIVHTLFGKSKVKNIEVVQVIFFVVLVLLIGSRIALLAQAVIGVLYLFKILKVSSVKAMIILVCFVFIPLFFLWQGNIKGKTTLKLAMVERFQIWDSALNVIREKPVFGHGVDQEHDALGKDYFFNGKLNLMDKRFNSHSNILSTTVQLGVVGLFLSGVLFIYPAKIYSMEFELFAIWSLFFIVGLTESFIHRFWGIIMIITFGIYVGKKHLRNI